MTDHWREGDLVRLKSGGPQMVVDRVIHYSDESTSICCACLRTTKNKNLASRLAG
jgi:uncharacterized protein YodC (DUF2158 family)